MNWFPESQDHLPLTWWGQRPIYLAAVIAVGGVVSMVATSLIMLVAGWQGMMPLVFSVNHVLQNFWVWTPASYVLVNQPSLWFLLTSYLLWSFGEPVERHLGRRVFIKLFLLLLFVQPVLLGVVGLFGARDMIAMGLGGVEFGVFLAFATLYPTSRISIIILTLEVWVLATAVVAVSALAALASRDWAGLLMLAGQVGVAVGYIRYETGLWTPSLQLWPKAASSSKPTLSAVPKPSKKAKASATATEIPTREVVDAILDKISRKGISSLTPEEKRKLELASKR